jgi:hypothetical protein
MTKVLEKQSGTASPLAGFVLDSAARVRTHAREENGILANGITAGCMFHVERWFKQRTSTIFSCGCEIGTLHLEVPRRCRPSKPVCLAVPRRSKRRRERTHSIDKRTSEQEPVAASRPL